MEETGSSECTYVIVTEEWTLTGAQFFVYPKGENDETTTQLRQDYEAVRKLAFKWTVTSWVLYEISSSGLHRLSEGGSNYENPHARIHAWTTDRFKEGMFGPRRTPRTTEPFAPLSPEHAVDAAVVIPADPNNALERELSHRRQTSNVDLRLIDVKLAAYLSLDWIYFPSKPLPAGVSLLRMVQQDVDSGRKSDAAALLYSPADGGDATYFLVWRGSTTLHDVFKNIAVEPHPLTVNNKSIGIDVHAGFYSTHRGDVSAGGFAEFSARMREIKELKQSDHKPAVAATLAVEQGGRVRLSFGKLRDVRRIVFCGHSLGGAVASVSLMELLRTNYEPPDATSSRLADLPPLALPNDVTTTALTFGAPMAFRVSKAATERADVSHLLETFRASALNIINGDDVVPRLPAGIEYAERHARSLVESPWVQDALRGALPVGSGLVSQIAGDGVRRLLEVLKGDRDTKWLQQFSHGCPNVQLLYVESSAESICVREISHRDLVNPNALERSGIRDSLLAHHIQYFASICHAATYHGWETSTMDNCVTTLVPCKEPSGLVEMLGGSYKYNFEKWHLVSHFGANVNRLRMRVEGEDNGGGLSRVVSVCGDTGSGKSFLITELQRIGCRPVGEQSDTIYHPPVSDARVEGENQGIQSTSSDATLFTCDFDFGGEAAESVWLIDTEGTNGTDPRGMAKWLREATSMWEKRTGLTWTARSKHVEQHLPVFALLTCDVFCWVTRNDPQNKMDIARLHAFAKQAWNNVLNRSGVTLFIFITKTDMKPTVPATNVTTEQFARQYAATVRQDIDMITDTFVKTHLAGEHSELTELFARIRVVYFPTKPDEFNIVERDGMLVQERDAFKMAMYEAKVGVIKQVLCEELKHQAGVKQHLYGDLFNKAKWLSMVPKVISEMDQHNYVSMAKLEVQSLFADTSDSLFSDVIKLFSERVSWPIIDLSSPEAMSSHVLDALTDAKEHAARLIVGKRLESERNISLHMLPEELKSMLKPALDNCLRFMTNCLPCCCQTDAPRDMIDVAADALAGRRLICGQPKAHHGEHKHISVTIPGRWFGRRDGEWLGEWDGSYIEGEDDADAFAKDVFDHAELLLKDVCHATAAFQRATNPASITASFPPPSRRWTGLGSPRGFDGARLRTAAMAKLFPPQLSRPFGLGPKRQANLERVKRQRLAMADQDLGRRLLSSCFLCTQNLTQRDNPYLGLFANAQARERIDLCKECDESVAEARLHAKNELWHAARVR